MTNIFNFMHVYNRDYPLLYKCACEERGGGKESFFAPRPVPIANVRMNSNLYLISPIAFWYSVHKSSTL